MAHRVRPASNGGDRRFGRSLAQTLAAGRKPTPKSPTMGPPKEYKDPEVNFTEGEHQADAFEYWHEANPDEGATYDEASGPTRTTRRPVHDEWEPYTIMDVYNRSRGQEG